MNKSKSHQLFKAFADPTRLRLLHILTKGERCVCDIMAVLKMGQSKVSRHLAYLRRHELVTGRRQGLWIHYSLTPTQNNLQKKMMDCLGSCLNEEPVFKKDMALLQAITEKKQKLQRKANCL